MLLAGISLLSYRRRTALLWKVEGSSLFLCFFLQTIIKTVDSNVQLYFHIFIYCHFFIGEINLEISKRFKRLLYAILQPGYKENAGIFCHNNPWISIAETVIGRGTRAFEIYRKTCPSYIEDISEIHRTEPYVYSQMIAGKDAPRHGEAKNSWLTGTAAWTFVNLSQAILGVQPSYDGLCIDPCVPSDFGDFTLTRKFRGAVYHIEVKNPDHVEKGVLYLDVDGKRVEGNLIPIEEGKKEYHVTVHMG